MHHGHWTHWSSEESSGVGDEEGDLSLCPPAARRTDATPALLEDIWTCCLLSWGVSSTDCQGEGGPIGTSGGEGLPWVDGKEAEVVIVEWKEGRYVDGVVVSCGWFLLERKI